MGRSKNNNQEDNQNNNRKARKQKARKRTKTTLQALKHSFNGGNIDRVNFFDHSELYEQ